jgi:hypothetical protein
VGKKHEPRWLWHAIDHRTGKVLAYIFGRRQDEVFLQLKALLQPLASRASSLIIGEHMPGIWLLKLICLLNAIRSRLSGSI